MTRDRQWQPLRLLELPFDFEFSGAFASEYA